MVRFTFLDPLFQDFFQLFYFGHLFLSIFQNLITFIKENCQQYILLIFELKAALNSKLYYLWTLFNYYLLCDITNYFIHIFVSFFLV
jgi:hypothetical protein